MRQLMFLGFVMAFLSVVSIGLAQDTTSAVRKSNKKNTLTKGNQQTNSKKQERHFIKENCLAATTLSMLIKAESIANRGDEEELRDYVIKYYPLIIMLKQGGEVKIIDAESDNNFVRVRADGTSYWMEKRLLQ